MRAEKEQEEARRAFEQAQQRVIDSQEALDKISREYVHVESLAKKTSYEIERRSLAVENHSEKVRRALRQKEQAVLKHQGRQEDAIADSTTEEENAQRLQVLNELREQERQIAEESSSLEAKATQLLSRAKKLKERAEGLEKQ